MQTSPTNLLMLFWRTAAGFWRGTSALLAWGLALVLVLTVALQLFVQYKLNYWSRDFFNAVEQKSAALLWTQALVFVPLAATSLALAVFSVWGRMRLQREWRRWVSRLLYESWLRNARYRRLQHVAGEHQTPEYRIAEDARVATDLPVDLVLGLVSSILTATVFIGILYGIGQGLELNALETTIYLPGYLVIAVICYSTLLTLTTLVIGRRLIGVIENFKAAEAELRAAGAQVRAVGESTLPFHNPHESRSTLNGVLDRVIDRWRALCRELMRMTVVSHTNTLVAPSIGLLLCAPKYIAGTMTLGAMVQAAAAFVVVQGAFSWFADSFGRFAEWASSARRVASLVQSLNSMDERECDMDQKGLDEPADFVNSRPAQQATRGLSVQAAE
jgi:vitamin B12/bleomycin/antimicrobial peptide transport system ATP-binding/permease protein